MNFITFDDNDRNGGSAFDSVFSSNNDDFYTMELYNDTDYRRHNGSSALNFEGTTFDKDEFELWNEFETFRRTWETLIEVYVPLELVIMSLGLVGNLLALATLVRSHNLCTPSFVYHRALVFADFIFCSNYFFNVFLDKFGTIRKENQFEFGHWWTAYYSGVVYHAIHLTCTYIILYMTIVIAVDRFVALLMYKRYIKFNRTSVASTVVVFCVLLSTFVHAWAPWIQRQVVVIMHSDGDSQGSINNNDSTLFYTWIKRQNLSDAVKTALHTKDIYNGVTRIAYPLIISILTIGVIYGFVRRQRHITVRYATAVTTGRQRSRYEKTLFFFMIAVVVLTFVEIGSSEGRRFLEIIYPPGEISSKKLTNYKLPLTERLYYFRILLYGYQISRVLSNLCTAINRSFVCYLYMAMNNLFRKELLALLCCCRPVEPAGLMRPRTSSHSAGIINNIFGGNSMDSRNWITSQKLSVGSLKNFHFL